MRPFFVFGHQGRIYKGTGRTTAKANANQNNIFAIMNTLSDCFTHPSLSLIVGALIALGAAWLSPLVTARHISKKIVREEKKAEYVRIISSLKYLSKYYERLAFNSMNKVDVYKLDTTFRDKAANELFESVNLGDLFISKDAALALREMENAPQRKWKQEECGNWEIYEADAVMYKEVAGKIAKIARKELGKL